MAKTVTIEKKKEEKPSKQSPQKNLKKSSKQITEKDLRKKYLDKITSILKRKSAVSAAELEQISNGSKDGIFVLTLRKIQSNQKIPPCSYELYVRPPRERKSKKEKSTSSDENSPDI